MKTIVVTEITRFKNTDIYCLAGIDLETGKCIRPKPYLKREFIEKNNIKVGDKLVGYFQELKSEKPHVEDSLFRNVKKIEGVSLKEFYEILENDSVSSVKDGFNVDIEGKKILEGNEPEKSIITLKISSELLDVVRDDYGKIRVNVEDMDGGIYPSLALTELKNYKKITKYGSVEYINAEILASDYVYLRIGISRLYKEAYWLQVNGIYCDIEL